MESHITPLLKAADQVRAVVAEAEALRNGVGMTLAEWRAMYHYTCSLPTNPRPGFVYASGPHKQDSDPTTDPWYRVEVVQSAKPGYVDRPCADTHRYHRPAL